MCSEDTGYQETRDDNREVPVMAYRYASGQALCEVMEQLEQAKASLREKARHPFHVVNNLFSYRKARYRGIAEGSEQIFALFGLVNLMLARRWLLAANNQVAL